MRELPCLRLVRECWHWSTNVLTLPEGFQSGSRCGAHSRTNISSISCDLTPNLAKSYLAPLPPPHHPGLAPSPRESSGSALTTGIENGLANSFQHRYSANGAHRNCCYRLWVSEQILIHAVMLCRCWFSVNTSLRRNFYEERLNSWSS